MCDVKYRVEQLEARLQMNRLAFDAVRRELREGMTECDARSILLHEWESFAKRQLSFSGDVIGGARSSMIEGEAGDYALRRGDALILDIQPGFEGCWADTARTFFIEYVPEDARRAYEAVRGALTSTEKTLRAGARACDIYNDIQCFLNTRGYGCLHHAGHCVGAQKLLEPRFVPECTARLEEGMLVTLEPGAYINGKFGVRLENNYLITKNGSVELFRYSLDIEEFIL